MISEYEDSSRTTEHDSLKLYAMSLSHKHLPEIVGQCGLHNSPCFMPVVGDFHSGMLTTIPLHISQLKGTHTVSEIREVYKTHYKEQKLIKVLENEPSSLFANTLAGRDDMEIFVSGSDEQILLSCRFDNLGKGAAGAAIECFNIMCGLPNETGLSLG